MKSVVAVIESDEIIIVDQNEYDDHFLWGSDLEDFRLYITKSTIGIWRIKNKKK